MVDESEDIVGLMEDAFFSAYSMEQLHKPALVWAMAFVSIAEGTYVPLLHFREILIKLAVEVIPTALSQGHADTEAEDSLHFGANAVIQQPSQVLLAIIDEGQYGADPDHGWDTGISQRLQDTETFRSSGDIRFQDPAEIFFPGGKGYLHHASGFFVDRNKEIKVSQDASRLGLDGQAEAMAQDHLQAAAGDLQLLLEMDVGIAHGAGPDHACLAPALKLLIQDTGGISLDLDILERVLHLVTGAAAVAIDTSVAATAKNIHPILGRKDRLVIGVMQIRHLFGVDIIKRIFRLLYVHYMVETSNHFLIL